MNISNLEHQIQLTHKGAQQLSGKVLDSRLKGCGLSLAGVALLCP